MADARELTYGISFNSEDAVNDVEQLEQGLGRIDDATDRAQIGAQNCSQAMSSMGAAGTSAARDVGSAAQNMGERFEEAGDDIGDKFRKMGAQADSFGAAFKKTMAAGIKDGQSLAKSFQTGVSGAISFTQKKLTGFKNDVSKGAKAIGNAFKHPIQTIKDKLSKAIIHAADSTDALEDGAGDAEKALDDMGNTGSEAGNKVKEAVSGALKAFLGIVAIKAAASAIKEFATARSTQPRPEKTRQPSSTPFSRAPTQQHGPTTTPTRYTAAQRRSKASLLKTKRCIPTSGSRRTRPQTSRR